MEKYSSYKDSGVKWLGEIPSHWDVVPLKYCISINNGRDYKEYESSEGIPVIGTGGQFAYSSVEMYRGEVVFFGRKGTVDKPFYYNGSFWAVDTVFFAIPKNNMLCKYLYYVGTTIPFGLYSTSTAIPSMTQTDLMNNPFALPPLSEQQTIVSYLDSVTSQIDTAISQQQKMIELLNERKQIIINNAVTKGLDPTVKMKDSGVDWIGEIPEHWEVCSLKKVATIILGKMLSNNPTEKYPYLCAKDVHYGNVDLSDLKMMYFSKEERERYRVQNGDMLIVEGGAGAGGCAVFDGDMEVFIQNSIMIVRGNSNMDNRFICYFFQTINQKGYVEFICNKATIPHFTKEKVGAVMLPIPPIEEQMQIVNKIKSICEPIDNAINAANKQITLLQERKQIIINEVVTGKVKVS